MTDSVVSKPHNNRCVGQIAGRRRVQRNRPTQTSTLNKNKGSPDTTLVKDLVKTLYRLTSISTPEETAILHNMLNQVDPESRQEHRNYHYEGKHQSRQHKYPKKLNRVGRTHHRQVTSRHTNLDRSHFKRVGGNT